MLLVPKLSLTKACSAPLPHRLRVRAHALTDWGLATDLAPQALGVAHRIAAHSSGAYPPHSPDMARGQRPHRCRNCYHHLRQSVYPHQRAATRSGSPQPRRSARPRVIPESSTAGSPCGAGRREHEPSQLRTRSANARVVCLGAGDDDHDARRRAHALSTARAGTNPYVFSISQSPRSCNDISPPVRFSDRNAGRSHSDRACCSHASRCTAAAASTAIHRPRGRDVEDTFRARTHRAPAHRLVAQRQIGRRPGGSGRPRAIPWLEGRDRSALERRRDAAAAPPPPTPPTRWGFMMMTINEK